MLLILNFASKMHLNVFQFSAVKLSIISVTISIFQRAETVETPPALPDPTFNTPKTPLTDTRGKSPERWSQPNLSHRISIDGDFSVEGPKEEGRA